MPDIEVLVYEKLINDQARCEVCQRRCVIVNGEKGFCSTRQNKNGKLYAITYGLVSIKAFSLIETKPMFHFFPGSTWLSLGSIGCNFKCQGCQNAEIAYLNCNNIDSRNLTYYAPAEIIKIAKQNSCKGISWTYNEPTVWFEYVLDVAKLAKAEGLYTNFVTNGYIGLKALEMLAPYLDSYCLDIKGFSGVTYISVAGTDAWGGVLETLRRAKTVYTIHTEVSFTVIPGYNSDEKEFMQFAGWLSHDLGRDTPLHIRRFIPYGQLAHLEPTPLRLMQRFKDIAKKQKLPYVYLGNIEEQPMEPTLCHKCRRLIIERKDPDQINVKLNNGSCPQCKEMIPGRFAGGL